MVKKLMVLMAVLATMATCMAGDETSVARPTAESLLNDVYNQIIQYDADGWDVPAEMYAFYFKLDRMVNPDRYTETGDREGRENLDQLSDRCPGAVIVGPEEGPLTVRSCGSTRTATNDCSYPYCRLGRDVIAQLEVDSFDEVVISTCGSSFDTYLCLYRDECCGDDDGELWASNNNNSSVCGGQTLTSAIETCLFPGTYYIILDGAGPAAAGSYCLTVEFTANGCGLE